MKRFLPLLSFFFLLACQNNGNNKEYASPLTDTTSATGLTGDSVKLVKTAGIQFKVANVEQSLRAVSVLAQQNGGMTVSQTFEATQGDRKELKLSEDSLLVVATVSPEANLTVRVPTQNLEAFLFAVADLGYFTASSTLQIDDRSLLYLQNALQQKARNTVLAKSATAKQSLAAREQTVALSDEAVNRFIANKTIDAEAAYSTVSLHLFQNAVVKKEVIANYTVSGYELSFGERLKAAVQTGWNLLLQFVLALMQLWTFVLLAIVAVVCYRHFWSKSGAAIGPRP